MISRGSTQSLIANRPLPLRIPARSRKAWVGVVQKHPRTSFSPLSLFGHTCLRSYSVGSGGLGPPKRCTNTPSTAADPRRDNEARAAPACSPFRPNFARVSFATLRQRCEDRTCRQRVCLGHARRRCLHPRHTTLSFTFRRRQC